MAVTIASVEILSDAGVNPIVQDYDIIGLNVTRFYVRVKITRDAGEKLPEKLRIEIKTTPPNTGSKTVVGGTGIGTLVNPVSYVLFPTDGYYKGEISLAATRFNQYSDSVPEVATVVRPMGSSDQKFRGELKGMFAWRGCSTQPPGKTPELHTGSASRREPDAKQLFLSGGVEVLEVSVPEQLGFRRHPTESQNGTWAFVRSPADIFFYTGHGHWSSGHIILDGDHPSWLTAQDLLDSWKKPSPTGGLRNTVWDMDCLIFNCCSLLFWNRFNEPVENLARLSYGLDWQRLLISKEGPLRVILGFRYTAPDDSVHGNRVALEMAKAIKSDLGNKYHLYAQRWMEICKTSKQTWTAAAIDEAGYYYINSKQPFISHDSIVKPLSFVSGKDTPEGCIIGPITMSGTPPTPPKSK